MFWRDFTFDLFKAFSKHTLVCQGHLKVIKINREDLSMNIFVLSWIILYEIVKLDFMLSFIAFVAR